MKTNKINKINALVEAKEYHKVDIDNPYKVKDFIIYLEQEQYNTNFIKDIINAASEKFGANWQVKIADEIYSIFMYLSDKRVIDIFGPVELNDVEKLKEILEDLENETDYHEVQYSTEFKENRYIINSFKNFIKYNFKTMNEEL